MRMLCPRQEGKTKQPYYVHLEGGRVLKMAGLYDACQVAPEEWLHTFTILTTDSSKRLQWLVCKPSSHRCCSPSPAHLAAATWQ